MPIYATTNAAKQTAHLAKSRPETEIFLKICLKTVTSGAFWCILVNCTSHFSFGAALLVCGPYKKT